jgi:hypothetical protein
VDLNNHRLFVAALGNNTVEVLDIKGAKRLHTISGLHEPQGFVPRRRNASRHGCHGLLIGE